MAQIPENEEVAQRHIPPLNTSLYVGDLDDHVTDTMLTNHFNQVGEVVSVRICMNMFTHQSLGYGYVNYSNHEDAKKAIEVLNFTSLNNKPIRVMFSNRDPSARKSSTANLFVKNLDKEIDNKALHETFVAFGNILSCKVAVDPSGQSKGYGFVQFEKEGSAREAIDELNGSIIHGKQLYVGQFRRKQERESALRDGKFNNLYVKNLSESVTEGELNIIFGEYGPITSTVVMRDIDGISKRFGFVNFANVDDAAKALEELNGTILDGKELYVGKAQKKSERQLELKERYGQTSKDAFGVHPGSNLYLKNLDDSVDDEKLCKLFSVFGLITSCKIMRDPQGISRGSGFVAFSCPDSATWALSEMNGKMVAGKPLYVAHAQRKEERRAKLQEQFSQTRPVGTIGPRMPLYPLGAPGMGPPPPFFYRRPPVAPAFVPQAGFGYQQQFVPGMRPGGAPPQSLFVPGAQQGQQGQLPSEQRGAGPTQQLQQPMPSMQPMQMGHVYACTNVPVFQQMPIQTLSTALASASPEQQRIMLGETLYPLVDKLEHNAATKITGMILQMDQAEVLHLIESPDDLKDKVAEAMNLLRDIELQPSNNPVDHLAFLSISE
ncbi:polyadenylate-binding protein 8-like [Abrus precatorius]|uniref:Polyadenylate-binding protein n=1 Tax=Abrus precatorius TaxID=3816 RepID=A0A8B8LQ06_ABRPR|nr:polyadenylate-binding protein 8-like [Abrus precatorius]